MLNNYFVLESEREGWTEDIIGAAMNSWNGIDITECWVHILNI